METRGAICTSLHGAGPILNSTQTIMDEISKSIETVSNLLARMRTVGGEQSFDDFLLVSPLQICCNKLMVMFRADIRR